MTDTYRERMSSADGRRGLARAELRYRAVELIGEVLESEGISQRELAARLGKSEAAVSQVLGGDRNLTLNTLSEYLDALDHRIEMRATRCVEGTKPFDLDAFQMPRSISYGLPATPYRSHMAYEDVTIDARLVG